MICPKLLHYVLDFKKQYEVYIWFLKGEFQLAIDGYDIEAEKVDSTIVSG